MKSALITSFLVFFCFYVKAEDIKMCSTNFAPWVVDHESSPAITTGISPQLVNRIFSKSKIKETIKLVALPFERCLLGVRDGTYDGVFFLAMVEERKRFLTYSESYAVDESFIFYKKKKPFKHNNLQNLNDLRVGLQRGLKYGEEVDKLIKQNPKNFRFTARVIQLVEMLNRGRIDFFITSRAQYFDLKKRNPDQLKDIHYNFKSPLSSGKYYLAFSNKSKYKKYLPMINKTIKKL